MPPAETVKEIYAAYERGETDTILNRLAEDVEWDYAIEPLGVPWLERRRGKSQVPQFFASHSAFELHRFQPKVFLENGSVVVVLIDVELTVKSTGRRIVEQDEIHIWHFDTQGRITKFGHKVDTHQHWIACGGRVAAQPGDLKASAAAK